MELKDFIQQGLERSRTVTMKALDGLSHDELKWRPCSGANSIGLILFHQAKVEDTFIQARIQGKPTLWEAERWHEKLGLPAGEEGAHYSSPEQVNAFRVPELTQLLAYHDAVRARTAEYLGGMTADKFDRIISTPRMGSISVGYALAFVLVHTSEHAGDICYLRGLQRGMDK